MRKIKYLLLLLLMLMQPIVFVLAATPSWVKTSESGSWLSNTSSVWRTVDSAEECTLKYEADVTQLSFYHVNTTLDALTSGTGTTVGMQTDYYLKDEVTGEKYGIRFNTVSHWYSVVLFVFARTTWTQVWTISNDNYYLTSSFRYDPSTPLHAYIWANSTDVLAVGYYPGQIQTGYPPTAYRTHVTVPTTIWNGTLVQSIQKDGHGWTSGTKTYETLLTGPPVGDVIDLPIDEPTYTIQTYATPGGTITPSSAVVGYGATQSFTMKANAGYNLTTVLVDGLRQEFTTLNYTGSQGIIYYATYTFVFVNANHVLTAIFDDLEGAHYGGIDDDYEVATIMIGVFLCLGLGAVGFAIGGGKEPIAALFLMIFGVAIAWQVGWFPFWVFLLSIVSLALLSAWRFSSMVGGRD